MNDTNTFVGGNFFGGGGVTAGANTIFMCGGDYVSKRATKVNIQTMVMYYLLAGNFTTCMDNDSGSKGTFGYTPAYFYVGGNMYSNILGKVTYNLNSAVVVPENYSRDLDIYSNTNMFVGGSLLANCKVNMKQNVKLIVAGAKQLSDTPLSLILGISDTSSTFELVLKGVSDSGTRSALYALNKAGYFDEKNEYAFFTTSLLDENVCSSLIVNGAGRVTETTKIRDMTKTYFYGDFSSGDYVEIGKALDGNDETEAKEKLFTNKTVDYSGTDDLITDYYSNAAYMYVGGDFQSGNSIVDRGYTKIYASSTLKVAGDFWSTKYLTLRHDAKIYVGKKLKAYTSIDCGSYSNIFVNGSMEATTSYIKIRDKVTCSVGGNMVAPLSYIELGKSGDYTKTKTNKATVTEGGTGSSACDCCDDCTDNEFCQCGESSCIWENGTDTSASDAGSDSSGEGESVDSNATDTSQVTIDTEAELSNDESDKSLGSKFYIGGTLASYLSYIKEFGYSQVVVGKYVYTPKYITIRHNADMWVLPEMFENVTYKYTPYVSGLDEDASLLAKIVDSVKKFNYEMQQTFTPKNGSIYSLGELTLNKNASLMGSYDCYIMGQTILRQDTLIYMGHDFTCSAPSVTISYNSIKQGMLLGFESYGTAADSSNSTTFPVVIYADNDINISTTISMKLTYLIANKGDVNLYDVYSTSDNEDANLKELPNAICSYQGNIDYYAMYGKLAALFYAPASGTNDDGEEVGVVDLDGYYEEVWGCILGNRVKMNTYYLALHRFNNWKTMDLHVAESGNVYLISKEQYENAVASSADDDEYDMFELNSTNEGGASLFFSDEVLNGTDDDDD
jgi:hypothetical protein